jgi:hypothetical protein
MKDMRHHRSRIQRDVIRAARREAAEIAAKKTQGPINGQEKQASVPGQMTKTMYTT